MGMENSFAAEQLCYNACNSAPITPRSPSFNGYSEEVSQSAAEQAEHSAWGGICMVQLACSRKHMPHAPAQLM